MREYAFFTCSIHGFQKYLPRGNALFCQECLHEMEKNGIYQTEIPAEAMMGKTVDWQWYKDHTPPIEPACSSQALMTVGERLLFVGYEQEEPWTIAGIDEIARTVHLRRGKVESLTLSMQEMSRGKIYLPPGCPNHWVSPVSGVCPDCGESWRSAEKK